MKLIADTREKKEVKQTLTDLSVEFVEQPLDVGDFALVDEASGNVVLLLERKTCRDLAASMNDGRYREQKARLLVSSAASKGYLIEGVFPDEGISFPGTRRKVSKRAYHGFMSGAQVRDKLTVFHTSSLTDTVRLLVKLMEKLPTYGSCQRTADSYTESLVKSVSTSRKANMTPRRCFIAMLCQIPGVSVKIAEAVAETFPGMGALLQADVPTLQSISLGKRRLGKVLAKRIHEYLFLLADSGKESKDDN